MKKALIFAAVAALMLTSCGGQDIAIIGGADGPTSITVSTPDGNKTPVRMIKAEGDYYYDTGVCVTEVRCGTLDGNLKKTADILSVPRKDGGANFGGKEDYFGYQNNTGITKIVPADEGWSVFRRVEDYGENLSRYKYCYKVKGRHPNAAKDSEYLVMTNEENITFDMVTKYFFSSQLKDHQLDAHIIPIDISDDWGISLYVKDETPEGCTVVFEQLGGNPAGKLQTGTWYKLEKYEDGKWVDMPVIPGEQVGWNAVAYMLPKNEISEFKLDWKWLYGQLSAGTYRLSKEVSDFKGTGDFEEKVYSTQFVIE